jgi:predicted AAA+ superfamily ATPase
LRRLGAIADVAVETVSSYLDACEQAYLIFSVPFFGYTQSKTRQRNKKYYAIDSGLRHCVLLSRAADIGKDFENYVFLQLKKKYSDAFYSHSEEGVFICPKNLSKL